MVTRGKQLDKVQLAYTAGFFDGEGWISTYIRDDEYHNAYIIMKAGITNTSLKEIKLFKNWFGGRIDNKTTGHPIWKDSYNWVCTGNEMKEFIELILPYLKTKRKRAELLLKMMEFDGRGLKGEKLEEIKKQKLKIHEQIKFMNLRGKHPQRLNERNEALSVS